MTRHQSFAPSTGAFVVVPKENEKSEPFSNRKQVRIFLVWWTNRTINRTFLSSSAAVLFFFSSRDPFIKPPHDPGHLRGRRVSFLIKQIIFSHFRSALPPGRQICRPRCTFRTCWPGSWPPGWALNTAAGTRLSCGRCRNISNKTQKQPRGPDGSRGCCYMYGR